MKKLEKNSIIEISEGFDRVGKMIKIHGEEQKLYRIINNPYKEFFQRLFESKKLEPLFDKFLVETKISDEYAGENDELILEHEIVPDINYLFEWSREMTKDAGVFLLDATIELIKKGLFLKDSHAFNLTYSGRRWYFLDYGSIVKNPAQISHVWITHFFHNFVLPVNYFQISEGKKYRELAAEYLDKPFNSFRFFYFSFFRHPFHTISSLGRCWYFILKCRSVKTESGQLEVLAGLRAYLQNLKIKYPPTKWGKYYQREGAKVEDLSSWNQKMKSLAQMVKNLPAKTLLDLGGNTGFYSKLVKLSNSNIKTILLTDYDEVAVDMAYKTESELSNTSVTDFRSLSKDIEVFWKPHKKTVYPNFASRHESDLVLMLALVHHLIYYQNLSFEEIVETVRLCSKKWIIIEFVSNDDFHIKKWFKKGIKKIEWYNMGGFKKELEKYFKILSVLPSGEEREDRFLILCEKNT
ncbi:MAG: hypothetical protein UU18_C0002G0015 [Parcubacteria group bacterium GW2011_GWB2_40_8]|nr:MAG: hypothetical protein UU18_C0002G0015 [Parcubacteria group bacterium GW2011_GWB2_40_8]OHE41545.1 MAG: hypothetical protein A2102_01770 [Tenericutes bacterium GWF2_38_8]